MLVLMRKQGQQILMDKGSIQMKILKVEDDVIFIGINAPQHIDIDREEIYRKKLQQEQVALALAKAAL